MRSFRGVVKHQHDIFVGIELNKPNGNCMNGILNVIHHYTDFRGKTSRMKRLNGIQYFNIENNDKKDDYYSLIIPLSYVKLLNTKYNSVIKYYYYKYKSYKPLIEMIIEHFKREVISDNIILPKDMVNLVLKFYYNELNSWDDIWQNDYCNYILNELCFNRCCILAKQENGSVLAFGPEITDQPLIYLSKKYNYYVNEMIYLFDILSGKHDKSESINGSSNNQNIWFFGKEWKLYESINESSDKYSNHQWRIINYMIGLNDSHEYIIIKNYYSMVLIVTCFIGEIYYNNYNGYKTINDAFNHLNDNVLYYLDNANSVNNFDKNVDKIQKQYGNDHL